MDKLEALQAMLKGEYYIRCTRGGNSIIWYDDTVDKFVRQYDGESPRFTDINSLTNNEELAGFTDYEKAQAYAESNTNKGIPEVPKRRIKPTHNGYYAHELRESIVMLGLDMFNNHQQHTVIQAGTDLANENGVLPGALIDRLRNVFWVLSAGAEGRNNDKWGVSWLEPMVIELKDK